MESLHMWLYWEFELIKKISCMTQINMSSRWTARIKVEDREACFKMLRKRRLGGSKETDMGQRPEILESWRALCWRVSLFKWRRWLVNQDGFHAYAIEDSKSLAQSGYAQKNEDVDALTDWSKKDRHDHNEKLKWVSWRLCISFMHLSIDMQYYQEGCNISRFR